MVLFETPRLVVREFGPADVDALFSICGDPVVTRWVGDGTPLTRSQCEAWIDISVRNYATKGFGASAVVEKQTGAMVGYCGIVYGPERQVPEIIYGFGQPWWGRGYGSEVAPALLAYGLGACGLSRILATIAPENAASRRIAEKAGMVFEGEDRDADGLSELIYVAERGTGAFP